MQVDIVAPASSLHKLVINPVLRQGKRKLYGSRDVKAMKKTRRIKVKRLFLQQASRTPSVLAWKVVADFPVEYTEENCPCNKFPSAFKTQCI